MENGGIVLFFSWQNDHNRFWTNVKNVKTAETLKWILKRPHHV